MTFTEIIENLLSFQSKLRNKEIHQITEETFTEHYPLLRVIYDTINSNEKIEMPEILSRKPYNNKQEI